MELFASNQKLILQKLGKHTISLRKKLENLEAKKLNVIQIIFISLVFKATS